MKRWRIFSIVATEIVFCIGCLQAQVIVSPSVAQTASPNKPSGVKGVPFSAEVVNETSRVLGDGTRIHQETQGKSFRDSEGRTRTESEFVRSAGNGERLQHITATFAMNAVPTNS